MNGKSTRKSAFMVVCGNLTMNRLFVGCRHGLSDCCMHSSRIDCMPSMVCSSCDFRTAYRDSRLLSKNGLMISRLLVILWITE